MTPVKLDLGCGFNGQEGFTTIDKRDDVEADIVHDLETFPWPIEDNSVVICLCSHILEHIDPKLSIQFVNEIWRICRPDATWLFASPYAGSVGAFQDPTHIHPGYNEASIMYFEARSRLWNEYKPKPWHLLAPPDVDRLTNINAKYRAIKRGSKNITEEEFEKYGI